MRFLLTLLTLVPIYALGQTCSAPSPVSYAGFGPQITQADYFAGSDFLNALNVYPETWSLGSNISDDNLCIKSNAHITTFVGVKLRNAVSPNDNVPSSGNRYFVEPGYSPDLQGGTEDGSGPNAKWNVLAYIGLNDAAFDSVDVILHIDFDPCFGYTESDMLSINIGDELDNNILTSASSFSSFGINTNLGYPSIAALNPAGTGFDATAEGYYTFAIEVKNNCGVRKVWNEMTVYVQSETTSGGDAAADSNGNGIYDDNESSGCQNELACNYDCTATTNSGCDYVSCSGCTVSNACNYNPSATIPNSVDCDYPVDLYGEVYYDCAGNCLNDSDSDGVCDQDEVVGCQESDACNYNASATDSGSCSYPVSNYDCAGNCLNDADGDGICDELEVSGCTTSGACNFNSSATDDDGSCEFLSCAGCSISAACNYDNTATISANSGCVYASGCNSCAGSATDGTGTLLDGDSDDDGVCDEDEVLGCTNASAPNYDVQATEDDGTCQPVNYGCMIPSDCNYDASATYFQLSSCSPANGGSTPCSGGMAGSPTPMGLVVACSIESACNFGEEGDCEWSSCVGCMNPDGCDYDPNNLYPAVCDFSCYGCTNSLANNYDDQATSDDGSCIIDGCTSGSACNYLPSATNDDGTCEYESCSGCMDDSACSYCPTCTLNDLLDCVFPLTGYNCAGDCLNDADSDGVCDEFEINGCMDAAACNYDGDATDDDGTCTYPAQYQNCAGVCLVDEDEDGVCDQEEVSGCDISSACNYNSAATDNDGSCEFTSCSGCTIASACNYDPTATLSNNVTCTYIPEGWDDCDQTICTDSDNDGICDFDEPVGCVGEFNEPHMSMSGMVETAVAVADWATTDFLGSVSDDTGVEGTTFVDYTGRLADGRYSVTRVYTATDVCANTSQAAQLIIADESHPAGCTNSNATSYDAAAINDDGSCDYSPACLGDLNLDNIVGTSDLLILLSSFGLPCPE